MGPTMSISPIEGKRLENLLNSASRRGDKVLVIGRSAYVAVPDEGACCVCGEEESHRLDSKCLHCWTPVEPEDAAQAARDGGMELDNGLEMEG